jgi:SAM-dependent methyltransferase
MPEKALTPEEDQQVQLMTRQYADERNLAARMRLHQRFSVNPQPWSHWAFDLLAVETGARVLELGAGPGTLWAANRTRIPPRCRFALTDISTGMLAAARRSVGTAEGAWHFAAADAQAAPFRDGSFDVVIANHMLYHVPDRPRAIAEARRVLRPGGRFCAAANGREYLREIDELARRFAPGVAVAAHVERFGLETGEAQLRASFDDVTLLRYEDALAITEAEPVVDYILSMTRRSALGEAAISALRDDVASIIEREGVFRVRKGSGMFIAH